MSDFELNKNPDPLDYKARMSELGIADRSRPGSRMSENAPLMKRDSGGMTLNEMFVKIIQPCLAELFGIAFFVFIGTSSMASGDLLTIGAAHGIGLGIAIASLGAISGGHLNPAVTLGVAIAGGISPGLALLYVLSQLIGAMLGAACCRGILDYTLVSTVANESSGTVYESILGGTTNLADHVGVGTGTLAEIITTTLLVIVVLMTAVDNRGKSPAAPFYIGLTVMVGILAAGNVSGGSMNPARTFGPVVVYSDVNTDVWDDHWVYWVGPLAGGLIAGGLYRLLFADEEKRLILKED